MQDKLEDQDKSEYTELHVVSLEAMLELLRKEVARMAKTKSQQDVHDEVA